MVDYYSLGPHKRISDIVFAGSHDASITSGAQNVRTQTGGITMQAMAGVRIFDLRILAQRTGDSASLVGYHGGKSGEKTVTMTHARTGNRFKLKTHSSMSKLGGGFGEKLSTMLAEGRDFVTNKKPTEFLIFKFDKCTNYSLIAEYCVEILGDAIYKPVGEFAKRTLDDLKGQVVCVFPDDARAEITAYGEDDGIIGFRSLKSDKGPPKPYDAKYKGLQYMGKGGTDWKKVWKSKTGKMSENFGKQSKLMGKMAAVEDQSAGDVLGMMYWTSTGLKQSIETRNDVMWTKTGVRRMQDLWEEALEDAVGSQLRNQHAKYMDYGDRQQMKAFIPNIVMIDFADAGKCQTIYDLNFMAEQRLSDAVTEWVQKNAA